jgi:hypothetical protein
MEVNEPLRLPLLKTRVTFELIVVRLNETHRGSHETRRSACVMVGGHAGLL